MGYIFLRIKIEVAPFSTEQERQFWRHDIPIARDYNKTLNGEDGRKIKQEFEEYLKSETRNFRGVAAELLRQDLYQNTHTWSPLMQKFNSKIDQPRQSVINFDSYYKSMTSSNDHNKHFLKHSDPIKTPKSSLHYNPGTSSQPVNRQTIFVDIESTSNDDAISYGKFKVTPAKDNLIHGKL